MVIRGYGLNGDMQYCMEYFITSDEDIEGYKVGDEVIDVLRESMMNMNGAELKGIQIMKNETWRKVRNKEFVAPDEIKRVEVEKGA